MSVDYAKLKTNLNLIMHRLKLVEKKKMELNQKARRTIGEFLNSGKVDRAKIRVEQIIREDYLIEAMDLVESYCDLLISRFGQLQSSDVVEEGLAPAISSLIWVTPRFGNDVPELRVIAEQLGKKYGKQYVLAVKDNQLKTVNETLMSKCGVQAPPRVLVEKYLVEIAKDQKIDYKPDPRVLKEQEVFDSTGFRPEDDDHGSGGRGGGGGSRQTSQIAPQGGFNLIDLGDHYPRNPITQPFSPYDQAPPLPSEPPLGQTSLTGPSDTTTSASDATAPTAQLPIGFNLANITSSTSSSSRDSAANVVKKSNSSSSLQKANNNTKHQQQQDGGSTSNNGEGPPPNYDSVVSKPGQSNQTQYYSFGPDSSFAPHHQSKDDLNDTLPELPPVPKDVNDGPSTSQQDDTRLDFEDLTRRFEELKNKKN